MVFNLKLNLNQHFSRTLDYYQIKKGIYRNTIRFKKHNHGFVVLQLECTVTFNLSFIVDN